jgi:hypothetical protein
MPTMGNDFVWAEDAGRSENVSELFKISFATADLFFKICHPYGIKLLMYISYNQNTAS